MPDDDRQTVLSGPLRAAASGPLRGEATAPGDKSISHRALIFSAIAQGESIIAGLLEGDDILRTASALRALGVEIERDGEGWRVHGGDWAAPSRALYFGNSGTGARIMMGAVAGARLNAAFDGDASLRARPMGRVLEPLRMMGAHAMSDSGRLPLEIDGRAGLSAVACKLAKPSAQVKSAILLAALGADGTTRLHEPVLTRDHTERMLTAFGASLGFEGDGADGRIIEIEGGQRLSPAAIAVPGDPSSAAFLAAAAVVTPGSDVLVRNMLVNPLRLGFYETLREMGAELVFENERDAGGERVADLRARFSLLKGVDVPAKRAASMIDEYPILGVVAAFADGETRMAGVEELRVKESDRAAAIVAGLTACGVSAEATGDLIRIRGTGRDGPRGGARVRAFHDHRIAMSFLVMGAGAREAVEVDDASMIATSYPDFVDALRALGASIERP